MDFHISPQFLCGAFAGVAGLTVILGLLIGYAYDERTLWWHAGAVSSALLDQLPGARVADLPAVLWAAQLAFSVQTMRATLGSEGPVRGAAKASRLLGIALACWVALQFVLPDLHGWLFLPWAVAMGWYLWRAWPQSLPWAYWLAVGQIALAAQWLLLWRRVGADEPAGPVAGLGALAVFASATYLSLVWRSRLLSENALRFQARERVDPLTGLATPRVFVDVIDAALVRTRNLRYTSALLLLRLHNLDQLVQEQKAENGEAFVLAAAQVIAGTLRGHDVAARLATNRFGVLVEGLAPGETANNLATRILAHGLRGADFGLPGVELRFQVVVQEVAQQPAVAMDVLRVLEDALHIMSLQPNCPPIRALPPLDSSPTPIKPQVIQT